MNKNFWYLNIGQAAANLADTLYIVSLVTLLFRITGKATYTASIPLFVTIALFTGGIFAPVLFNKFSYRKLLISSQIMKNVILTIIILLLNNFITDKPYFLFLFILLISLCDSIATPLRNSIMPLIVEENNLYRANSLVASLDQLIRLGAWPLGAILISLTSSLFVLIFSLILYLISTLFVYMIAFKEEPKNSNNSSETFFKSIKEGWILTIKSPKTQAISLINIFEGIANGVWIAAIIYIFVDQKLGLGEEWWGYINSAFFGGMLVGSFLSSKYSKFMESKTPYFIFLGSLSLGLVTLIFGNTTIGLLALVLSLVYGVLEQIKAICIQTSLQRYPDSSQLPKIFSVQSVVSTTSFGISTIFLGFITDKYNVTTAFEVSAFLFLLSFLVSLIYRKEFKTTIQHSKSSISINNTD
ncbi:MFS transporter [Priestia megaterium]|nr:MFS transporter [Priestia megaterium]